MEKPNLSGVLCSFCHHALFRYQKGIAEFLVWGTMHQTELDDWIGAAVARCVETLLPNHALALIDALSAVASLAIEGVTGLYATGCCLLGSGLEGWRGS